MEKRGKFTLISLEKVLDKYIGAIGTPERTAFDKEVDDALDKYNNDYIDFCHRNRFTNAESHIKKKKNYH